MKRFDAKSIKVDLRLQENKLAPFFTRSLAFGLDWIIILLATKYFGFLLFVFLVFLIFKKRLGTSMKFVSTQARKKAWKLDQHLEKWEIEESLRKRFRKQLTFYIVALIYLPFVVALLSLVGMITGYLNVSTESGVLQASLGGDTTFFEYISQFYNGTHLFASAVGSIFYFALFTWYWKGQTPGKRLFRLKVVKISGGKITFKSSLERATGYTASAALFFFGFFQFFWDKNHQCTHDKISETIVVSA